MKKRRSFLIILSAAVAACSAGNLSACAPFSAVEKVSEKLSELQGEEESEKDKNERHSAEGKAESKDKDERNDAEGIEGNRDKDERYGAEGIEENRDNDKKKPYKESGSFGKEGETKPAEEGACMEGHSEQYDTVLSDEAELLCGDYFKEGNYGITISITSGGRHSRNTLQMRVKEADKDTVSYEIKHGCEFLHYEGARSHFVTDLLSEYRDGKRESFTVDVSEGEKGVIRLAGIKSEPLSEEAGADPERAAFLSPEGTYYSTKMLYKPEAFERPLNDADLIGMTREELWILRNQFYAVYGRVFEDDRLTEYFSEKPWYVPTILPEEFSDAVFGGIEKRNIEFIKKAEENFDPEKAAGTKIIYDALPEAPYAKLLPERGEILVQIYPEAEGTEDKRVYYEAYGKISVPVIVTPLQYETVMKEFGEVEIPVNELTGEKRIMKISDWKKEGDCILYDPSEEGDDGEYYFLSYEPYSGNYNLSGAKGDTYFKPVYEGKIYVLKGAEEEYYNFFPVPMDEHMLGAGALREMDFSEAGDYASMLYSGNIAAFDKKGYLRGLYYDGD